jgi:Tol biopolymer transport system component
MTGRKLAALLLPAAVFGLALHQRRAVSAADGDSSAWGAIDPAWSPDGSRLAFALYGSIWEVPAEGGVAAQISHSSGYHSHPSWSPKGDAIAFISGNAPAGRIPNIGGRLRVVSRPGGEEREIATPLPTAGKPAFSPDGQRIACGLLAPNVGSLIHEIPLHGGEPVRLQQQIQRGPVGVWNDASWSRSGEIFFATQRGGRAGQIWSMPSRRPPIMVQLPLTRFRAEDIALLDSVSAIPDGSGAVYSTVVVNGRGNYELYRVSKSGGDSKAITNTDRDEFAPAVSPEGTRVAYVSNHLGNIDIFVRPLNGGEAKPVRIDGLKFRSASGKVRVKVLDETGQPARVRLFNTASDGKSYSPRGAPIFYQFLDPAAPRAGFFVASGDDEFPAPAGPLKLTALKGIEYRIADRTLDVPAGQTAEVTIQMERWTNWNQRGWHTGENHFHANYNGSYYQRPRDSLAWLEAEDLNTANMIVANSEGQFVHDKEFFRGAVDPLSKPRFVLYWGQEYRNSDPLGHMAFLNIIKQVPPSYTSVIGSDSPYDFPLNTMAALEAKKQGGVVSYVHPIGAAIDVFDTNLGAKEAPLSAALGAMDAIDILPRPANGTSFDLWYRLLNAGFHIAPGAGTDVFTNWRGINNIPGSSRQYVETGPGMRWDRWIERYKEGRAFVTNGPLLTFQMNGNPMGAVVRPPKGQPYTARLSAEVTSRVPVTSIELLKNGEVIEKSAVGAETSGARIEKEVTIDRSAWFAVRATGPAARGTIGPAQAHSAPIYVEMGGEPTLVKEDVDLMIRWLERLWAYLEERNNFGPGENRARARRMFDQGFAHYRTKLTQAR